jgi:HAD superfamily hydrolase (TIGR01509 family)
MIEAIIFDFDGLILDTEVPEYEAWRSVYQAHGVDLPLSTWVPFIGGGDEFDPYGHLAELTGDPVDREEVRRHRYAVFDSLLNGASPLPGIEDYIAAARELGLGLGIASSSDHSWVDPKLEMIGFTNVFDTVVCADDVGSSKPNPASYLGALSNLGARAGGAFALEDSPNGVKGAKNAGLFCVAVPSEMTKDQSFDHADMRLESLADMPLPELLEVIS